jgi:hydrogenase-4 component B
VLHATGTRRISSLGGLARTMPHTFVLFLIGAVAICGLPPLNGFASELLLYMGLLRAGGDTPQGWAWASLAAPVLAMIGALAVASFVKVAGVAFCGSARSSAAARAHDPGRGMLAPMGTLAGACMLLGLFPGAAVPMLQRAVAAWDPALGGAAPALSELAPLGRVSALGVVLVVSVAVVTARFAGRRSEQVAVPTWDCGYASPTPRMQYVEASFSETLVGLFDWALRSRRRASPVAGPVPARVALRERGARRRSRRRGAPVAGRGRSRLARARAIQRGPVQAYRLYILLAVMACCCSAGDGRRGRDRDGGARGSTW